MILLLTAFEPFNNQSENASYDILNRLDYRKKNVTVHKIKLPVHYDACVYRKLLLEYRPDIILHLGEAARRPLINLEKRGINRMDASIPDNQGTLKSGEPINPLGLDEYLSTIPVEVVVEALKKQGFPIDSSESAGTYICNLALYSSLEAVRELKMDTKVGFIHFPRLSHQNNPKDIPTLPLDVATETLQAIIDFLTQ